MGGLIFFDRVLPIASDDFFMFGMSEIIINFTSLITTFISIFYETMPDKFYFLLEFLILISAIIIDYFIIKISLRGTIAFSSPRLPIKKFLYFCLSLLIFNCKKKFN